MTQTCSYAIFAAENALIWHLLFSAVCGFYEKAFDKPTWKVVLYKTILISLWVKILSEEGIKSGLLF